MTDFIFGIHKGDVVYDCETYPNVFTIGFKLGVKRWLFEISDRVNDIDELCTFIELLSTYGCRLVGFNNIGFDYPVLHFIYQNRNALISATNIYTKAMSIIESHGPSKFSHMVWESNWVVHQIDLFKIHHFDNISKSTSLKVLEFNMRMESVDDLPFPVGTPLKNSQIDELIHYMWHDIDATELFLNQTQSQIKLREELSSKYGKNMINMSDVKLGEVILIDEIQRHGVDCYEYQGGKKVKRQTVRDSLDLGSIILPYIRFDCPEFNNILNYFRSQHITETKGVFKGLGVTVGNNTDFTQTSLSGIKYTFGTGGLHASVDSQIVETTDTHQLIDVDVASFYPNLSIKNNLHPAHLGKEFCDAYLNVYETRKTYKKGTPENAAFKLALNGAYGGSNNKYSPFYDPLYTMAITVNGQLSLCMLVDQLIKIPGLSMIQANTDGVTYLCPHEYVDHTRQVCTWWENTTGLELEEALYSRMFIRDVNSYIAEYSTGGLKRIGVYAHVTALDDTGTRELPHHKDWSARVIPLAAEAALVRGECIRQFVNSHTDPYDFLLRTKVPRNSSLLLGDTTVSNIIRYYVSEDGQQLSKVMPPKGVVGEYKRANKLTDEYFNSVMDQVGHGVWDSRIHTKNKSTYEVRTQSIHSGHGVKLCDHLSTSDVFSDVNYEWYIHQVEKIVNPLTVVK